MQPEQPQYPANYLDTIATPPPTKTMNPLVLWGMIVGVLVLAVTVVVVLANLAGGRTDNLASFGARMAEFKTLSQESQENIQSSDLRTLNSSLTLVLTNANRDLQAPLAAEEIDLKETESKESVAVAAEMSELKQRLEDARLNAVFDRTYAREVSFALKSLNTEIVVLHDSTSNKELQSVLETTYESLETLEDGFTNFNEA